MTFDPKSPLENKLTNGLVSHNKRIPLKSWKCNLFYRLKLQRIDHKLSCWRYPKPLMMLVKSSSYLEFFFSVYVSLPSRTIRKLIFDRKEEFLFDSCLISKIEYLQFFPPDWHNGPQQNKLIREIEDQSVIAWLLSFFLRSPMIESPLKEINKRCPRQSPYETSTKMEGLQSKEVKE